MWLQRTPVAPYALAGLIRLNISSIEFQTAKKACSKTCSKTYSQETSKAIGLAKPKARQICSETCCQLGALGTHQSTSPKVLMCQ